MMSKLNRVYTVSSTYKKNLALFFKLIPLWAGISILISIFSQSKVFAQYTFTERDVSFQNEDVTLTGTLITPNVDKKVPAIVFVHGSGPQDRDYFREYAETFAKLGVASLFYDKRGTGSSGGSWTTSSLDDLAKDAIAAIEYLKNQEAVDAERIGFWGISQAGWVTALTSSKTSDLAFMIMNSGGGVTPKESELYSFEKVFEMHDYSEESKTEAFKILDGYYKYLETGEGRSELATTLDKLETESDNPLSRFAQMIYVPSEKNRINWSWVSTYDPLSAIEKMNFPVLLLFGEKDTNHPTELAVKKWREGLEKAGNDNVTTIIFPEAGHGIRLGAMHNMNAPFADGYMEVQLGWLWKNVIEGDE